MKQNDRYDDVLEGNGFKMARRGRFLEVKTHRSSQEQRELNQRLRDARPEILKTIEKKTDELLTLIHKYTSLDLIANLFLKDVMHDPDTYVESETKLRPHWVEHATVLELGDPRFELRGPVLVDAHDVQRAHELLQEIFLQVTWYYIGESGDPNRSGPPSRIDELRFVTLLHGISVRSPAYSSHWREVLLGLFRNGAAIEWLDSDRNLSVVDALAVVDAIETYITSSIHARFDKARETHNDIVTRLADYNRQGLSKGSRTRKNCSTACETCAVKMQNGIFSMPSASGRG